MPYDRGALQSGGYDRGALQSSSTTQTVTLPSLASPAAFGTMVVAGPIILPSLVGPQAFGDLTVAGGDYQITLPGIPTPAAFGTMIVAGPITLPSLASPAAFGTMVLTQPQDVVLPSLASPGAFGSHTVRHVQVVLLPSIASPAAFGTHVLSGGIQRIRLASLVGPRAFGRLTVTGGRRMIRVYIGGIERTNWLVPMSASIDSQTIGRWRATFDFYVEDSSWAPVLNQTVLIQDFGNRLFAGCVSEVLVDRPPKRTGIKFYRCEGIDKNGILDRRVCSKTYLADEDAADVVRDIVVNFLDGEGFTVEGVPATLGELGADLVLNQDTAAQAFDMIRDRIGGVWWSDTFQVLNYKQLDALGAAPFSITQTSRNWRNLTSRWSLVDYATEVFARTNRVIRPPDPSEGGPGTGPSRTESFTLPQQAAVDRGFVFGSLITALPIFAITSISVNGTPMDFFSGVQQVDWSLYWWYFSGAPYITPPVAGGDVPSPGDTVEVTYIPLTQNVSVDAGPPAVPEPPGGLGPLPPGSAGTCGSGRFQTVLQVNEVDTQAGLDRIAEQGRERRSGTPLIVEYETDTPGLEVGMLQTVNLPDIFIPTQSLLVTGVSGRSMVINLGHDSSIRWRVRLVSTNTGDLGNWQRWLERIITRSNHPNPIPDEEIGEFVLEPGGSLSSGVVSTNPYVVKHTGRLREAWAAFSNPATGQNLRLQLAAQGFGNLLGPSGLLVPAGSLLLATTEEFYATAPYVYRKQLLSVTAAYEVTGPSQTPAANGTFGARWEY